MRQPYVWLLFIAVLLMSCKKDQEPKATSAQAQAYLDEVIGIMQIYSVNRKTIDWDLFKNKVYTKAQGAQTIADTHPSIQLALTLLGDNHSFYTAATGGIQLFPTTSVHCTDAAPTSVLHPPTIGYIQVPPSGGYDAKGVKYGLFGQEYAQALQDSIKAQDSDQIQAWIIDLRALSLDMFSGLVGIGPILGEGIAGYFMDPDGNYYPWSYEKGAAKSGQSIISSVPNPYVLRNPNPKVAVLTNRLTSSSGEALAIAFIGRPNTRSFGFPTCGLSTANAPMMLSDGARLALTVGVMADRNKKAYGNAVQPDELLPAVTSVQKAIEWLSK
ncbi:S41 family peptidase [Rhodocytophaga aerolata]|nr:S41 family peptidase [Rhodocytophaga aerolata]